MRKYIPVAYKIMRTAVIILILEISIYILKTVYFFFKTSKYI